MLTEPYWRSASVAAQTNSVIRHLGNQWVLNPKQTIELMNILFKVVGQGKEQSVYAWGRCSLLMLSPIRCVRRRTRPGGVDRIGPDLRADTRLQCPFCCSCTYSFKDNVVLFSFLMCVCVCRWSIRGEAVARRWDHHDQRRTRQLGSERTSHRPRQVTQKTFFIGQRCGLVQINEAEWTSENNWKWLIT